jgi:hypothetical protein
MNHIVLVLKRPFNQQEPASGDHYPVSVVEIWRHNHIGDARLIFHRNEDEPLRGEWIAEGFDFPAFPREIPEGWVRAVNPRLTLSRYPCRRARRVFLPQKEQ